MEHREVEIGARVKSLVAFCDVPAGTEGVIDELYEGGCMVAWDRKENPLPKDYVRIPGKIVFGGPLRDGFSRDELHYLKKL
jgi:hypothetical protein